MPLNLMYITNDPDVAVVAQRTGVDRVWVDLETIGKEERQRGCNSVKSHHTIEDIRNLRKVVTTSELQVRVNPINPDSRDEINRVVEAGADIIMLPMWKSLDDVQTFLSYVDGRTKTTLLLETKEGVDHLDEVLTAGGFDEIHICLNDLHLSYGMSFMFEPLANGMVDELCMKFKKAGILYGFGGIARIGEGMLPAENVVMEHYRLGSTRAILSRSFCNTELEDDYEAVFDVEMKKLRSYEVSLAQKTDEEFAANQANVSRIVAEIVQRKKEVAKCN